MQQTADKSRVHLRWFIRRDLPEVVAIEAASFEYPWTEEDFLTALRERNCLGFVAEYGEAVVGYYIYDLEKKRLYLRNFAVHPRWRRLGVGEQMIAKLVSKLSAVKRTHISLNIRESNIQAQLFFRRNGFFATSVARRFYEDAGEDSYVMERHHVGAAFE